MEEEGLPGGYKDVQPGDCVVAFSRNDIYDIKATIESATGRRYGPLQARGAPGMWWSCQAQAGDCLEGIYKGLGKYPCLSLVLVLSTMDVESVTWYWSAGPRLQLCLRHWHMASQACCCRASRAAWYLHLWASSSCSSQGALQASCQHELLASRLLGTVDWRAAWS